MADKEHATTTTQPIHPVVVSAAKVRGRVRNLLDGADIETARPWVASGTGGQIVASGETVWTNYGELDADTVVNNRVGGVGVVHILADKPGVTT